MRFREGTSKVGLDQKLIELLEVAEYLASMDFEITSAFREGDDRSHGQGLAVDIACATSRKRFRMLQALYTAGFNRIGVYDLHIHVDRGGSETHVLWTGVSQ